MIPGRRVIFDQNYIRNDLGYRQVFVQNGVRSYSQQGSFANARRSGSVILARGPNSEWPNAQLVSRSFLLANSLVIFIFNGQSNDVGATAAFDGTSDPTAPFTQIPPIPSRYFCYTGGLAPTQSGVDSDGVADIIDTLNYATFVPAAVNINTLRTPGHEVNRQQWCASFGQAVAAALPQSSAVLMIDVGHGGTSFGEDVQASALVSSVSWLADVITFVFVTQTYIAATDTFVFTNATNTNYNGTWTAVTSDGFTVTVARVGDPGAYTGTSGFGLVWAVPIVNARNMIRRAVSTLAPALGMTPYFGAICYNGNESSDDIPLPSSFISSQYTYVKQLADEFTTLCGAGEGIVVWPQVDWPVASWSVQDNSLFNCASNLSLGVLLASQTSSNKCITFSQHGGKAGGAGDVQSGACIHFSVQGHCDHGEIGANLWLDFKAGTNIDPLQILAGEDVLTRVANSQTVASTYNKAAAIDTAMYVSDPGTSGYQFFTGVTNIAGNDGGTGLDEAVASVSVSGTTFGLTTTSAPTRSWGNFIGHAYNNATRFQPPNNTRIQSATWAADVATYTTVAAHGLSPGDTVVTTAMVPIAYDADPPGTVALAGTTGSTLKVAIIGDPGTATISTATWSGGVATYNTDAQVYTDGNTITVASVDVAGYNGAVVITSHTGTSFTATIPDPGGAGTGGTAVGGGSIANNGTYGVGRTQGLRGTVRQASWLHYSNTTGAPLLSGLHAMQFVQIDVYASTKSITAALTELDL